MNRTARPIRDEEGGPLSRIMGRVGLLFVIGGALWGCTTVVPVYLDTGLDAGQQEAIAPTAHDSVQVAFVSRVQATRFSPFGRDFEQDREGMFGVHIPISKALGALVEDYAHHKFERLHGVTRRTLDSLANPSLVPAPDSGRPDSALPSGGTQIRVTLIDFRIKEYVPSAAADSGGRTDENAGAGARRDTAGGAEARGLVRGARMIVRVGIRRDGTARSTGLHASIEHPFARRTSARWRPVVNALNNEMLAEIDRYLEAHGRDSGLRSH